MVLKLWLLEKPVVLLFAMLSMIEQAFYCDINNKNKETKLDRSSFHACGLSMPYHAAASHPPSHSGAMPLQLPLSSLDIYSSSPQVLSSHQVCEFTKAVIALTDDHVSKLGKALPVSQPIQSIYP